MRIRYPRYDQEEIVNLLRGWVLRLAEEIPITLVMLFGSWGKGRETASSDIDILIVYREPRNPDAFNIVSKTLWIAGGGSLISSPRRSSRPSPRGALVR